MNALRVALLVLAIALSAGWSRTTTAQSAPPPGFSTEKYDWPNYYEGDVLMLNFFANDDPLGDYLDVIISGLRAPLPETSSVDRPFTSAFKHIFDDDGEMIDSEFEPIIDAFSNVFYSSLAAADYDRDGDIDLVIAGATRIGPPYEPTTVLFQNIGNGARFDFAAAFLPTYKGSVDWGDYDNDGDLDLLQTGVTPAGGFITALFRNNGIGAFEPVSTPALPAVGFGHGTWGDYDNDGDLDILLTGALGSGALYTAIHLNTGDETFAEVLRLTPGLGFSKARWFDYDADGHLDVLLVGGIYSPLVMSGTTQILRNSGNDTFEPVPFDAGAVFGGDVETGDLDNDGDLDLMIGGFRYATHQSHLTQLFLNQDGRFEFMAQIQSTISAAFAFGDHDTDGDLDIFTIGYATLGGLDPPRTSFYINHNAPSNTPPTPPSALQADVEGRTVHLSWNAATDDTTPTPGLTYNLRVGTRPGGFDVVAPQGDPVTGRRWVVGRGPVGAGLSWRLVDLAPGTYYWSVQAIDNSYIGSAFAEEGSFTIDAAAEEKATDVETETADRVEPTLAPGYPNPFRERTVLRCAFPHPTRGQILVYDTLGRHIRTLRSGPMPAGSLDVTWDGRTDTGERVATGLYLVRLETAEGYAQTQTMTVLR